jgi:Ca2+-transporting ATPase
MTGAPITRTSGLSTAEAVRRLAAEGRNEVVAAAPPHLPLRVARQLRDPLVALLLVSASVTALLRDVTDTAVIVLVVVVNAAVGVAQEIRAERAVAALRRLGAPVARTIRDGTDVTVPAAELVRGDVVHLAGGDIVPADVTLLDAQHLRVDESMLTGEPVAVERKTGDDLSSGTVIVTGRAVAVVARTGTDSALGRIAVLVATARPGPTPLQRRLAGLGRTLALVAVAASAVVLAIGLLQGRPLEQMAITAVSLVVAAVPESLPAVVTLALALGAFRMARANAVARRLHAVETLGSVTVVASDKTGTLTEGRMAVERAIAADGTGCTVQGRGYEPSGAVLTGDGDPLGGPMPLGLVELARAAILCNDARLAPPTDETPRWTAVGDPLEAALLTFAARCGLDAEAERLAAPRVAEEPFDALTRQMTTHHRLPDGRLLVVRKGAPEAVLGAGHRDLHTAAADLAVAGARVLALAAAASVDPDEAAALQLRPLGLVAVTDPVRAEAPDVVGAFAGAGIRLVLITGDHPATATAVGRALGLYREGEPVASGEETGPLPDASVYARIRPEQKLAIIASLQRAGHVVAMTGDGVNDAPALRRADIGVAMGAGGTEVARQAADLVLTDDNLATVATAVREGRRIYDNIRRFLRYALSGGLAELLVMLAGPALGLALPLLPAQILWVNS